MPRFTPSSFEELRAEQEFVQGFTHRERRISEYDEMLFPSLYSPNRSDAITDFLSPYCNEDELSISGILRSMADARQRPAHWADMGGGYGVALRQAVVEPASRGKIRTTNVDLLALKLAGLGPATLKNLDRLSPGILDDEAVPQFIQANAETVCLPEKADFVTAFELKQYLDHPLGAFCNWYNQTADDGFLAISTDHNWSAAIRYQGSPTPGLPMKHVLKELRRNEVPFAACTIQDARDGRRLYDPTTFRVLAVQKKAGTLLRINMQPARVTHNKPYLGYKQVRYQRIEHRSQPVSVVTIAS